MIFSFDYIKTAEQARAKIKVSGKLLHDNSV